MLVRFVKFYKPVEVHGHPDHLYVFGDNLERRGRGGQAVIRGFANAAGVPTKRAPRMDDAAFFDDADYDANVSAIADAIAAIEKRLSGGRYTALVIPSDGLGTGRAQLARRAPRTAAELGRRLAKLVDDVQPGASARLKN